MAPIYLTGVVNSELLRDFWFKKYKDKQLIMKVNYTGNCVRSNRGIVIGILFAETTVILLLQGQKLKEAE